MKKKLILNLFLFLPLFAWSNSDENISLPYEESRVIRKSFAATSATSVEIINKYGDVNVSTWEKDSVKFEITISAKASKLSQAKELFEMADVKFTANTGMVLAALIWGENVNAFKRGSVEVTLAAGSSQVLRIDYQVFVPAGNTLKIENRFGNVFLPVLKGKTYLSLNHGNLRAEEIKNAKSINVKYGDVKINVLHEGELDVSFGDIEIEEAGDVFIQATSGTSEIEKADKLHIETTNEKIRIESVSDLTLDLVFSDIRVRKLKKKLNSVSKMGDLHVDEIASSFQSVNINAANGEVSLGFEPACSFLFSASMEKCKSFQAASSITITDDDKFESDRKVEGKMGSSESKKVEIDTKSSSVYLEISE